MFDFITLCDGYKLDHRRQYPQGTEFVYSNFTPRSSRVPGQNEVVFFGLQYFLREYLGLKTGLAWRTFFTRRKEDVLDSYKRLLDSYLGPNDIGVEHIGALWDYGRIPLKFWALPEGTRVPLRMPMFTFQNTHPDFFWMTNYIETLLSSVMWMPCTSATTAYRYRKLLDEYASKSGDPGFVPWQAHDFSFRGHGSPEAAALSGAGHLLSFSGTDTLPAIQLLDEYYSPGIWGGSVAATEHSVMCAGDKECERDTFERLLALYPRGILSVVSDTWDLWNVITNILPQIKTQVLARDGKLVIRPDSGNPADILCGDPAYEKTHGAPQAKGVVPLLWEIFGGAINEKGYRTLDPHIGAIYGDSITENRAHEICSRLNALGYASTNVVFGVGSYTYQYVTRDTYGFAVKATWAQINGKEHLLYKDPKTDNGEKKSAKGRISIVNNHGLAMVDCMTLEEQNNIPQEDLLQLVWKEGLFVRLHSVEAIRGRVTDGI